MSNLFRLAIVFLLVAGLNSAQQTAAPARASQTGSRVVYKISPADADPQIHRFLDDNYVLFERGTSSTATLLVFLSGTSGAPVGAMPFLVSGSLAGYRVIGLEYDDEPAVAQVCPTDPDPSCSGRFREKRVFGVDSTPVINDAPSESIVNRLIKLLQYLDVRHQEEGWDGYLVSGQPNWPRIAVSGHSQGAGMAAFIAKRHVVARVVMLSSPWDFYGQQRLRAPWLKAPSATPADRWYGAYHKRERQSEAIKSAFEALGVPKNHVRVFTLEPDTQYVHGKLDASIDVYHVSMVSAMMTPREADGTPSYRPNWAFLLGTSP